jgi:hypothetical protein
MRCLKAAPSRTIWAQNLFSCFPSRVLEDVQNQASILDNPSITQGFGASIITTRESTCLAAKAEKLDFSSSKDNEEESPDA